MLRPRAWYLNSGKSVTLVCAGEWQGLYIDGNLEIESHRLTAKNILPHLNIPYEVIHLEFRTDRLPKNLKDLDV